MGKSSSLFRWGYASDERIYGFVLGVGEGEHDLDAVAVDAGGDGALTSAKGKAWISFSRAGGPARQFRIGPG